LLLIAFAFYDLKHLLLKFGLFWPFQILQISYLELAKDEEVNVDTSMTCTNFDEWWLECFGVLLILITNSSNVGMNGANFDRKMFEWDMLILIDKFLTILKKGRRIWPKIA
jgi:hypothetical protein